MKLEFAKRQRNDSQDYIAPFCGYHHLHCCGMVYGTKIFWSSQLTKLSKRIERLNPVIMTVCCFSQRMSQANNMTVCEKGSGHL